MVESRFIPTVTYCTATVKEHHDPVVNLIKFVSSLNWGILGDSRNRVQSPHHFGVPQWHCRISHLWQEWELRTSGLAGKRLRCCTPTSSGQPSHGQKDTEPWTTQGEGSSIALVSILQTGWYWVRRKVVQSSLCNEEAVIDGTCGLNHLFFSFSL